jgi:PAS domain S-box-containing protein
MEQQKISPTLWVTLRVTLAYTILAVLWILLARWGLGIIVPCMERSPLLEMWKDGIFAIVSALLLAVILQLALWARERAELETHRANRALKTLSEGNQAVVRATDETALLHAICQGIVRGGNYAMAWVGFVEPGNTHHITPLAWAGHEEGYLDAVQTRAGTSQNQKGNGPELLAIQTRQPYVVKNIRPEPSILSWHTEAARRGYASVAAFPLASQEIFHKGAPLLGVVAIYSSESNAFEKTEIAILTELAGDLIYGITALRTRAERARTEARLTNILEIAANAIIAVDAAHAITLFNPAAELIFGYRSSEILNKPFANLLMPEFIDSYYDYAHEVERMTTAQRSGSYCEVQARRRDGRDFPIELSVASSSLNGETTFTIIVRDITAQKRAEEDLIASRDEVRTILESITDAFIAFDKEWRFIYANQRAVQMLQKSHEELLDQNVWEVFPEARGTIFDTEYHRVAEQQVSSIFETFYPPLNIWFEVHAYPFQNGVSAYFRNINERKQAEQKMHHLNRALRTISECNQVLVRATNENDLLSQVCMGIVREGGYRLAWVGFAEPEGDKRVWPVAQSDDTTNYLEALPPITWADEEHGQGPTGLAIRTGTIRVVRNIHTDPAYIPWRERALKHGYTSSIALPLVSQMADYSGPPLLGALNIYSSDPEAFDAAEIEMLTELSHDLAYGILALRTREEHRRAEEQLRFQKTLLECQSEAAIDGILVTSTNREWLSFNQHFVEMWHLPEELVATRSSSQSMKLVREMVCDPATFEQEILALYQDQRASRWAEVALKDGRTFERYSAPVVDGEGYFYGRVWFYRDITERKHLFDQFSLANERLQTLSRRMLEVQEAERRHIARELHDEVGQSLTGLHLLLEMTSRVPAEQVPARVQEAHTLVNDLMSQVRELSLNLRPAMLDDLGLLPTLRWFFNRYTTQTGIRVIFKHTSMEQRFDAEVETVVYRLIQEALTNVARHAEVDEVTVRLWSDPNTLGVQIEDHGVGFDPEAALARKTSSGLAGMQERVFLLGGELTIESAPGEGTCFVVELPLRQAAP